MNQTVTKTTAEENIERVILDPTLSRQETIDALKLMYTDARAEQRAATESAMVDDDGLNRNLRAFELALHELDVDVEAISDDHGAATL